MLRTQDVGELAYGGAVTLADWWDGDRIKKGTLADKDIVKKAGFWTFAAIGVLATALNIGGWWRRGDAWTERLMHGFIYGLPGVIYSTVNSLRATTAGTGSNSAALRQAQEILRARQAAAAGSTPAGGKTNYNVINPYEILT